MSELITIIRMALFLYTSKIGITSKRKLHDEVIAEIIKSGKKYTAEEVMKHLEEAR